MILKVDFLSKTSFQIPLKFPPSKISQFRGPQTKPFVQGPSLMTLWGVIKLYLIKLFFSFALLRPTFTTLSPRAESCVTGLPFCCFSRFPKERVEKKRAPNELSLESVTRRYWRGASCQTFLQMSEGVFGEGRKENKNKPPTNVHTRTQIGESFCVGP